MSIKQLLILLVSITGLNVAAQEGTIGGFVYEAGTGEPVIGANVIISGTTIGGTSDLDGKFVIHHVTPGIYEVECSYISFKKESKKDVEVSSSKETLLEFQLEEVEFELEDVVIETKKVRNTESALISIQKKSAVTLSGISAAQITKNGDGDVASAMKRVTGVTVEGGKYIYVRGLGDRYTMTLLNGSAIPSLDPNRNSVQLDIFPSSMIDNLLVYKTFSPDLPGSFTGGLINIQTKDFPEDFKLSFSTALTYNPRSNLSNSFLDHQGGKLDGLGFDDGGRAIPENMESIPTPGAHMSEVNAIHLTESTQAFDNNLQIYNKPQFLNHSHAFSIGNQKQLFGKPIGYYAGLTYSREFESYNDGVTGRYLLSGNVDQVNLLNKQLLLTDSKSQESVLWGAMFTTSYRVHENHKVSFTAMRNQNGMKSTRYQIGKKPSDDPDLYYQTRSLLYDVRAQTFFQLKGNHKFQSLNNIEIEWQSSYTISEQDQPDQRFFTNGYRLFGADTIYKVEPSIGQLPTRYFREMNENSLDHKVDITIPFASESLHNAKMKVGGAFIEKDRSFRENQFRYASQSTDFNGDVTQYLDNVWTGSNLGGVYIVDAYDPANSYDGNQVVGAFYTMVDLPVYSKLRVVAGARYEYTNIGLVSKNSDLPESEIQKHDVLPSVNLNYALSDEMSLRASYSRTLARPTFREIAPFASFEFIGDYVLIGDQSLERTLIDNMDARWEFYPDYGEVISFSLFYKNFQNHIERTFNPIAANPELNYKNVDHAFLAGSELELKKNLGFISDKMKNLSIGANFTYVYSRADIDSLELSEIRATEPDAKAQREMFGQSPFAVNALVSYQSEKRTSANISFNLMGKRLSYIIVGGTPNVYELPKPMLDFNIAHELKNGFAIKFAAKNLLNAGTRFVQTFKEQEYIYQSYNYGPSFSVGLTYKMN